MVVAKAPNASNTLQKKTPAAPKPVARDYNKEIEAELLRVETLYATKMDNRVAKIKDGIEKRFATLGTDSEKEDFIAAAKDILNERSKIVDQRKSVAKRISAVEQIRSYPEKVSVVDYLKHNKTKAYREQNHDDVKNPQIATPTHLVVPSYGYRRTLKEADLETRDDADININRMASLINQGRDLGSDEIAKLKRPRSRGGKLKFVADHLADYSNAIFKSLTSGTDAVDTRYTQQYNQIRESLFRDLKTKIDPSSSNYVKLLNKIMAQMQGSSDPLSIASLNQMQSLIEEEVKKDRAEYEALLNKANEDMKKLETAMLGDKQKMVDRVQAIILARVMGVFLCGVVPFAPLAGIGFLNYLELLQDISGPLFQAGHSFGSGIGDAVTSDQFGFLGDLMDKMEIDKFLQLTFDNTPILKQFGEIWETLVSSDIGQNLMYELGPLIESPLLLLAIGGVYALSCAPKELEYSRDLKSHHQKHEEALKTSVGDIQKQLRKGWKEEKNDTKISYSGIDKRMGEFANKKYEKIEDAYVDLKAIKFFVEAMNNPACKPLLESMSKKFVDLAENNKFGDVKAGKMTRDNILKYFNDNPDLEAERKKFRDNFLLLSSIETKGKNPAELSKDFEARLKDPKKDELIKEQKNKNDEALYREIAKTHSVDSRITDPKKIKEAMIKSDIKEMQKGMDDISLVPAVKFSPFDHKGIKEALIKSDIKKGVDDRSFVSAVKFSPSNHKGIKANQVVRT